MSESMITKQAIARGFKQLMKEKTFDKITILDITKTCGLNRQTFYYHFQ
ncbi:MAG TPA: dihydroxyacetone kinase transcriptional activator DhaS, partial [Lachnospiraceae bacterium]|nr:dihydroxyacetone kinase transcriptional activator DhaS [Lachnospiraceae bacterium]